jgi:hypothetical protein
VLIGLGALGRPFVSPSISANICGSSRGDIGGNPSIMITAFSVLRRASSSSMTERIASVLLGVVVIPNFLAYFNSAVGRLRPFPA